VGAIALNQGETTMQTLKDVKEVVRTAHYGVLCAEVADNLSPAATAYYVIACQHLAQAGQFIELSILNSKKGK